MGNARRHLNLCLAASALLAGSSLQAQAQNKVFAFGDSFLDVGNGCNFAGGIGGNCSNGYNTAQQFALLSGSSLTPGGMAGVPGATDFAVGGTTVFPGTPRNYLNQIATFAATGTRIGPHDITLIASGQNEQFMAPLNAALARQTAANMATGVGQLVDLGGRNFVAWGGIPFDRLLNIPPAFSAGFKEYQSTLAAALPSALAAHARPGVQIRWLDINTLFNRAIDTPALYGFAAGVECTSVPGCATAPRSVQNQYPYFNLHPSDAFARILGLYINNLIHAQDELPAQADIAQSTAVQFANTIFGRLDAYRFFAPAQSADSVRMAYASMPRKAPPLAPPPAENPWSVYVEGSYAGGTHDDRLTIGGAERGFTYGSPGGSVGIEYRMNPELRLGLAFNYSQPDVNFNDIAGVRGGHLVVKAAQLGGYVSWTTRNWFSDVVLTYGHNDYDISRPGVIDIIRGGTTGSSFSAAWKGAYLFDVDLIRVGPILGLQYARSQVDAYTETGDAVLTQTVNGQAASALIGSAGVQLRLPFTIDRVAYSPFVSLTAERNLLNGDRTLLTSQTNAPMLPIYTVVPNSNATYGKVAAGMAVNFTGSISGMINVSSTFARAGGDDYGVAGSLKFAF